MKCGSKDPEMKTIFSNMDKAVKELGVHMGNIKSNKGDISQILLKMLDLVEEILKMTGTEKFNSYLIKNCPNEVVKSRVAGSLRKRAELEKRRSALVAETKAPKKAPTATKKAKTTTKKASS